MIFPKYFTTKTTSSITLSTTLQDFEQDTVCKMSLGFRNLGIVYFAIRLCDQWKRCFRGFGGTEASCKGENNIKCAGCLQRTAGRCRHVGYGCQHDNQPHGDSFSRFSERKWTFKRCALLTRVSMKQSVSHIQINIKIGPSWCMFVAVEGDRRNWFYFSPPCSTAPEEWRESSPSSTTISSEEASVGEEMNQ
jgi:hypothetical protein